jgi:hypothetical protein
MSTNPRRDPTWDAMCEFADRCDASGRSAELEVVAYRRRRWLVTVVEGLWVGDLWTDVFEPVRTRSVFGGQWTERQSVEQAAAKIDEFLRSRPDLTG